MLIAEPLRQLLRVGSQGMLLWRTRSRPCRPAQCDERANRSSLEPSADDGQLDAVPVPAAIPLYYQAVVRGPRRGVRQLFRALAVTVGAIGGVSFCPAVRQDSAAEIIAVLWQGMRMGSNPTLRAPGPVWPRICSSMAHLAPVCAPWLGSCRLLCRWQPSKPSPPP